MSQPPLVVELTTDVNSTVEHLQELGRSHFFFNSLSVLFNNKSVYTLFNSKINTNYWYNLGMKCKPIDIIVHFHNNLIIIIMSGKSWISGTIIIIL